jgi:hypothetical protein
VETNALETIGSSAVPAVVLQASLPQRVLHWQTLRDEHFLPNFHQLGSCIPRQHMHWQMSCKYRFPLSSCNLWFRNIECKGEHLANGKHLANSAVRCLFSHRLPVATRRQTLCDELSWSKVFEHRAAVEFTAFAGESFRGGMTSPADVLQSALSANRCSTSSRNGVELAASTGIP